MPDSQPKATVHRTYHLPVNSPRDTEILGSRLSTIHGQLNLDQLDWSTWWIDGPEAHLFNGGGRYFHVRCNLDPLHDGPNAKPGDERWFRVRCWWAGKNYKGWPVTSIGIGTFDGVLCWIVRTKNPKHVES